MAELEVGERLARPEGVISELSKRMDDLNCGLSGKIDMTNKRMDDLRSKIRLWSLP